MRRTLAAAVALVVVVGMAATAGTARGGQATHISFPISGDQLFPAGTICDFNLEESFTGTVTFTLAPNGTYVEQDSIYATHINLGTGYTLTEHDAVNTVIRAGSSDGLLAGIYWHLTTSSGQTVLVKAGMGVFDLATGEIISFTPNSALDQSGADVLCPALGGNPA
jgi:hypothetical protein